MVVPTRSQNSSWHSLCDPRGTQAPQLRQSNNTLGGQHSKCGRHLLLRSQSLKTCKTAGYHDVNCVSSVDIGDCRYDHFLRQKWWQMTKCGVVMILGFQWSEKGCFMLLLVLSILNTSNCAIIGWNVPFLFSVTHIVKWKHGIIHRAWCSKPITGNAPSLV